MSTSTQYEEAMLKLLATWTTRTIGTDIYLGGLSTDQLEITGFNLGNEIPNIERPDSLIEYYGEYIGKFALRAKAKAEIDIIKSNLTAYSANVIIDGPVTIKIHNIRMRGGEALFETEDNGQKVWNIVLNLICKFNPKT